MFSIETDTNSFLNSFGIKRSALIILSFSLNKTFFLLSNLSLLPLALIKIVSSKFKKDAKNKTFKIFVKGTLPMKHINSFVSLGTIRKNNTLFLDDYEVFDSSEGLDI